MERTVNPLTNPSPEQQQAVIALNYALTALAKSYSLNPDAFNELAGARVEAAILTAFADELREILPERDGRDNPVRGVDQGVQIGFNAAIDTVEQNAKERGYQI